jgi:ABC-type uncharacterized transport system permease subunit
VTRWILLAILILLVGAFSAVNARQVADVHFLVTVAHTHVVAVIFWSALLGFLLGIVVAWPRKKPPSPEAEESALEKPAKHGV